jgi:hypothetical protein
MFPISLQGMKASAALMPLLRQARDQEAASMQPPSTTAAAAARPEEPEQQGSSSSTTSRSISSKQQRWQRAQQQAATAAAALDGGGAGALALPRPLSPPPSPSTRQILARFHQLRQQAGAPHPIWVLASPLAQVPVFVTAMTAIRTMSLRGWPGFSDGGTAWFTDLTLPAMDLEAWTAPLGGCLPGVAGMAVLCCDALLRGPGGAHQLPWLLAAADASVEGATSHFSAQLLPLTTSTIIRQRVRLWVQALPVSCCPLPLFFAC